jgi:uncharacterized protein YlxP (DUF503 family)
MFVGVARMVLQVPGARSLKDKRRVVRAFRDRVRARLSVSIAEVGNLERYQVATLGASVVARESTHCSTLLSEVTREARGLREAILADVATEIIALGPGGANIQGGIEQALSDDELDPSRDDPDFEDDDS